ncbi:hypothetical protein ARMSODRAFT_977657 [Armillaria solidipes]|uniref:Uncharacterized protein n=1 Tax=Armillaria solidipes TaxID=1076256 RepID=A0A2H3B9P3_9AGAR|nr:hypothetical protein ARMSODRAFT_977657 [Armillaria solidipes]
MTEPLPADDRCPGFVKCDDETDEDWYEGACIERGRVRGLAEGGDHNTYTLIGSNKQYLDGTPHHSQYWAFGRRLPEQRFEKYSVFKIAGRDEIDRLDNLGVAQTSRNVLV